jgi:glucosamine--fructose-6-phosphate aminotransferase (isomerizing)
MSETILEQEVRAQPDIVRRLISRQTSHVEAIARQLRGSFDYLMIVARGSSDNAARYAKYLFGTRNRIPVALAAPSLWTVFHRPPKLGNALVLSASQSGASPDIVAVMREARAQGRPTLAIVNVEGSPLEEVSEYTIHLGAGEERAIAATKTYTASLAALALLSLNLMEDRPSDDTQLALVPGWLAATIEMNDDIGPQACSLSQMRHCSVIGRGYEFANAYEISLKLKELSRVAAEPFSSADFMHGPIAMAEAGSYALVITPPPHFGDEFMNLILRLKDMGAKLLVVSENAEVLKTADLPLPVTAGVPDWLFPIISVVPGQLLSLGLPLAKHLDPDHPEGLTKITTTW